MEYNDMYRSKLMLSIAFSPCSRSSCMHDFVARMRLDENMRHTPNTLTLGSPPALSVAPPMIGISVTHVLHFSLFPKITMLMSAVNAGVLAASACSSDTSTYLNDATARTTDSASVCDRRKIFPACSAFRVRVFALHLMYALRWHHRFDASM